MKLDSLLRQLLLGLGIVSCFVGFSIYINYQLGFYSVTHSEDFIPFFLSPNSILYKTFYYPLTDLYYRGRELANFFNIVDSYWIVLSVKVGLPHFLSITYYGFLIAIVSAVVIFGKKMFGARGIWVGVLLSIIYISSPAILFSGMYYRPTKILASFALVLVSLLLYRVQTPGSGFQGMRGLVGVSVMCLWMGLSDELGLVFVGLFFVFTGYEVFILKKWVYKSLFFGFAYGIVALWFYRSVLGPWLTYKIIGKFPSIWNVVPSAYSLNDLSASVLYFAHWVQLFVGSVPLYIVPFIFLSFIWLFGLSLGNGKKHWARHFVVASTYTSLVSVIFIVVLHVMRHQQPVIDWPEYSLLYYPVPLYTFFYVICFFICARVIARHMFVGRIVLVGLCLWVGINLFAIGRNMDILLSPDTKTSVYFHYAPKLIDALKHNKTPLEQLSLDHTVTVETIRKLLQ